MAISSWRIFFVLALVTSAHAGNLRGGLQESDDPAVTTTTTSMVESGETTNGPMENEESMPDGEHLPEDESEDESESLEMEGADELDNEDDDLVPMMSQDNAKDENDVEVEAAASQYYGKVGVIRYATDFRKCLHVSSKYGRGRAQVQLWDCDEFRYSQNQHWILPENGHGQIRWAKNPSLCLGVQDGYISRGTHIQLWKCGWNNQFKMRVDGAPSTIKWYQAHANMCLDVHGGYTENGTPIVMYGCVAHSFHQQFKVYYTRGPHPHPHPQPPHPYPPHPYPPHPQPPHPQPHPYPPHPHPHPQPPHPTPYKRSSLAQGQSLYKGKSLYAGPARLTLTENGDLVLYGYGHRPVWRTHTAYSGANMLTMNYDGNLILYGGCRGCQAVNLWNSGTSHRGGVRIVLKSSCNLVMLNRYGRAVWSTHTRCNNFGGRHLEALDGEAPDVAADNLAAENDAAKSAESAEKAPTVV